KLQKLDKSSRVLDIGSGYAGSARYLAETFGCQVACLNLSEKQNQRARELNEKAGLTMALNVVDGSFESIPSVSESVDIIWCQDAILHSSHRLRVFEEVNRVLAPGGQFIFTDPMAAEDATEDELQPILDRIQLESLGSVESYRKYASALGWEEVSWEDLTHQLV